MTDGVLTIQVSETSTQDYSNIEAKHQMLYKMSGKVDYDAVQLKVNGEDVPLDGVIVE